MSGFAQDLAIKLHNRSVFRQVFSLSIALDSICHFTGTTENLQNAHRKRVNDTLASLNPKGLSSQRCMWQLSWGPVVWKNGTDTSTASPDLSWYAAYHDNLEFEDGSLHPTYVMAIAGTPGTSFNRVVDFDAYVSDGQFKTPPKEVFAGSLDANKAYLSLSTARAIHTLLTSPAPSAVGVRTLLGFINAVKSTKELTARTLPRFVFTGHSCGGAIASSVALALVSGGVIPAERTSTYSTAAPSLGNAPFANLFERTFRARQMDSAEVYNSWNINLVNTLDAVPQAWCHQRYVSPSQNLSNIPIIYGTPIIPDVIRTTDVLITSASDSGMVFKPLPSRYFSGIPPSAPPANLEEFLRIAVQQHVEAYLHEVKVTVTEPDMSQDGLNAKKENDVRLNYPVIHDFERAWRGEVATSPGALVVSRASSGGSDTGSATGTWFGTRLGRNGARSGAATGTNTGAGSGTESEASTGTGTGRVAVTPLSSLTVLKYGDPEYNLIPQSVQKHPLLVYRSCFPDSTSVEEVKLHLSSLGVVEPHRTGTLLIRDHFYVTTHKVLCVTNGQAQLRFGGESNASRVDVEVRKGDVIIVPAGVPHRLLKDIGRDLEIVESYPKGIVVDADLRRLGSRVQQTHLYTIASLAWFTKDPIYGDQGPVLGC